jgi:pimeloyl-ACP methyl ester carboxylesterase
VPTVETNGVETYYEQRGSGPPIVFVHAMFMNTTQWEPQVEALADEFTTITYDVRGHGRTGGSRPPRYDIDLFARDLDALLDALDVEDPILCGLSIGGCIAQAYAARHPDRVRGLILADTFAGRPAPLSARLLFATLRTFAVLDRFVRYPTLNRFQLRVGNRLSPGVGGDADRIQAVIETGPTIPHDEFAKVARGMARFPDADIDLSRVTAPTLLMYGEHLPRVMREMHPRIAGRLTNAEVTVREVPDAGHASNLDNPDFFTEAVRAFASTHSPPG